MAFHADTSAVRLYSILAAVIATAVVCPQGGGRSLAHGGSSARRRMFVN
jgi:hypothetical protein